MNDQSLAQQPVSHHLLVLFLLGFFTLLCYGFAPVLQSSSDSRFTVLCTEHLLYRQSMDLQPSFRKPLDIQRYSHLRENGYPYQVLEKNGAVYYAYPPGTSFLITPVVWVVNVAGLTAHDAAWRFDPLGEARVQRVLASAITALFVMLVYHLSRQFLTLSVALSLSVVTAFGTMAFSTTSRALWSDTMGILILQAALMLLALGITTRKTLQGMILGTLLAWMVFVRPTYVTAVFVVVSWVWMVRREVFTSCVTTGILWAGIFAGTLHHFTGSAIPYYFAQGEQVTWHAIPEALPGHLFSPSRGLLILVPVLWFILWIALRKRSLWSNPLWLLAVLGTVAHYALISCWPGWWGGYCYGPRLGTGALPFMILGSIVALKEWWPEATFNSLATLVTLSLFSIAIHTVGATVPATEDWNARPHIPTRHAGAREMWDWRYPQALCYWLNMPLPEAYPAAHFNSPGEPLFINPGAEETRLHFLRGWADVEGGRFRWTNKRTATIFFQNPTANSLELLLFPYLANGQIKSQYVQIWINKQLCFEKELDASWKGYVKLPLPPTNNGNYHVEFILPDALSPYQAGMGKDYRLLGIRLEEMILKEDLPGSISVSGVTGGT